jgi:hypothetical protein
MFEKVKEYVQKHLNEATSNFQDINNIRILKSALVYQYLSTKYLAEPLSLETILNKYEDLGLIGPGHGWLTRALEKIFGNSTMFQSHAIYHDAFGRFYNDYKYSQGYCYALPPSWTPEWMKSKCVIGHVSGLPASLFNSI